MLPSEGGDESQVVAAIGLTELTHSTAWPGVTAWDGM